jgi:hypothetical protein
MTSAITSSPRNTTLKSASSCFRGAPWSRLAEGQPGEAILPYTAEDSLLINSGDYNTLGCQEACTGWPPLPRSADSARPRSPTGSETGASAASATGARRSRCSIARRTASFPCPTNSFRFSCRTSRDHPGGRLAAREMPGVRQRDMPEVRRPGPPRDRHDGHLRRFVLVFLPLHQREIR